jgi:penicillin V acylase-like amidase (Ntn superfamily)
MCSRIEYERGIGTYITGRGMDLNDPTATCNLWVFPKGMKRDGGIGRQVDVDLRLGGRLVLRCRVGRGHERG